MGSLTLYKGIMCGTLHPSVGFVWQVRDCRLWQLGTSSLMDTLEVVDGYHNGCQPRNGAKLDFKMKKKISDKTGKLQQGKHIVFALEFPSFSGFVQSFSGKKCRQPSCICTTPHLCTTPLLCTTPMCQSRELPRHSHQLPQFPPVDRLWERCTRGVFKPLHHTTLH